MGKVLVHLEEQALKELRCRSFVDSLLFPLETWTREIFVQLLECDFQSVPTFVDEDVQAFLEGLNATLLKELHINGVRRYERKNGSGKASPFRAWHITSHS